MLIFLLAAEGLAFSADPWNEPPPEARLRAYWWWLNGNVDAASITRDLVEMKAKGFGGAVVLDANGSSQGGHQQVPAGPVFGSPAWKKLFAHAAAEASRLDLELSLNIQSGWNLGGPSVPVADSVKRITWSETTVDGGAKISLKLASPEVTGGFYQDIRVVAFPIANETEITRKLRNWRIKGLHEKIPMEGKDKWFLTNSTPRTDALHLEDPETPGEIHLKLGSVVDLTEFLTPSGNLEWNAPAGKWQVLRFGMTLGESHRVSTFSEGSGGYAIDTLDSGALARYWDTVVEPVLAAASPQLGKSLKYLHTDSWEISVFNWTPTLPGEFKKRRGYDLLPWMPALAGYILESPRTTHRFLHDFRKTLGDLSIANHYAPFLARAEKHGMGIHPESGGPHYTAIDAQRALGFCSIPMSEFWAESATHRTSDATRFFVKQPASAAHVYGKKLVAAEGFTTVGPHWQETLWDNLKPSFDLASTEGLNRLVWHAFVCSPEKMGVPGQQYFAGTHLNPNVTWWKRSAPFFTYLNRCQWMLQQGMQHADALVYYGDHVPNYTQSRSTDPGKLGRGYDYDVCTEEAILTRLSVKDGLLVLPDGMNYKILTLPDRASISMPVLRKVRELVLAGATVVGPRPDHPSGLEGYPDVDTEFASLTAELWPGKIISGKTAREVLTEKGIGPDFDWKGEAAPPSINFIHRTAGETEIYFVANRAKQPVSIQADFRVSGKAPELWNAVTGERSPAAAYTVENGITSLPLDFPACGSLFVVFRKAAADQPATAGSNTPVFSQLLEVPGPWEVSFDPKWGGPAKVEFNGLTDWSNHENPGIKFYSGTAVYRTVFQDPGSAAPLFLDLGMAREIATVSLNGNPLGTLWAPPFRVDLSPALKPGENKLEIEIVNFWPNRIIGDASGDKKYTRTNIRTLTARTPLMPSGLLGPVRLLAGPGS